jgi:hypothetical protein
MAARGSQTDFTLFTAKQAFQSWKDDPAAMFPGCFAFRGPPASLWLANHTGAINRDESPDDRLR